ncbi:MAG: DUF4157 domain-containing protein [Euryarchaeota archaeon]|nr:DUF4157 domain-containing protein [Euryarchaeota archaeon]
MECDDELRRQPIDEIDEEEREELIQAKLADGTQLQGQEAGSFTVPPIVHEVLRSPGQPLGPETRTFMESRFGHDFSRVRVHTDARAAESARAVNALAYTVGHKIAFGTGQYTPETTMGQRLLAHELTHMVQQREQPRSVTRNLSINQPNDVYEREADRIAGLVTRGQMVCRISPLGSKAQIQREFTACFETNVEEFRRSPMCTPPTRVVGPGQSAEEICGVYPGGSTDCEVDEETGEISGRVVVDVSETNPCVSPCVDLHERVHERQLRPLCAALRDCYQAADASQRPVSDCWRMGLPDPQRECEAYPVSVICLEERLAYAPECADAANFDYAWDVLEGEKCYLDHFCREAASIRSRRRSRIHSSGPDSGISR